MDIVVSIKFDNERKGAVIQVNEPEEFFNTLPAIVDDLGCDVDKVYSLDDNLEAVFRYLVGW